MIWIGIGAAAVAWLIGLLLEVGPLVHLLLAVAAVLAVLEMARTRRAERW